MLWQFAVVLLILAAMAVGLVDRYRGQLESAQHQADLECAFGAGCTAPTGWSTWTVADNTARCPGSFLSLSRCQLDPASSPFERRRFDLTTVGVPSRARHRERLQRLGGIALDADNLIFERRKDEHRAAGHTHRRHFLELIRGE